MVALPLALTNITGFVFGGLLVPVLTWFATGQASGFVIPMIVALAQRSSSLSR
jgi:hypothetical protein